MRARRENDSVFGCFCDDGGEEEKGKTGARSWEKKGAREA